MDPHVVLLLVFWSCCPHNCAVPHQKCHWHFKTLPQGFQLEIKLLHLHNRHVWNWLTVHGVHGSFNYSARCFQGNFFELQGWSHKLTKRCKRSFNTEHLAYQDLVWNCFLWPPRFPRVPVKQQLWTLGCSCSCFPSSWAAFDLNI